jgi:hypothetical protein
MKGEGTRGIFDSQKQLRELTNEYDNLLRRTSEHKDRIIKETLKALEEMVEFKTNVSTQLKSLEKLAFHESLENFQMSDSKSVKSVSSMLSQLKVQDGFS